MRCVAAIFLSLLAHGVVAALVSVYIECAPGPDALAQLDLSSVELSFAETVDDSAPAAPAFASAPAEPRTEPLLPPAPAPDPEPPPQGVPPEPETMKIPEPAPESSPMETPPPPPAAEPPPAAAPSPAAAPRQARVDAPPSPRRSIKPDYPKGARQRGEQGDVRMEIFVSASGAVSDVRVVASSGYPELDEAAVKAVFAARFSPARRDGRPVASSATLTMNFRLK